MDAVPTRRLPLDIQSLPHSSYLFHTDHQPVCSLPLLPRGAKAGAPTVRTELADWHCANPDRTACPDAHFANPYRQAHCWRCGYPRPNPFAPLIAHALRSTSVAHGSDGGDAKHSADAIELAGVSVAARNPTSVAGDGAAVGVSKWQYLFGLIDGIAAAPTDHSAAPVAAAASPGALILLPVLVGVVVDYVLERHTLVPGGWLDVCVVDARTRLHGLSWSQCGKDGPRSGADEHDHKDAPPPWVIARIDMVDDGAGTVSGAPDPPLPRILSGAERPGYAALVTTPDHKLSDKTPPAADAVAMGCAARPPPGTKAPAEPAGCWSWLSCCGTDRTPPPARSALQSGAVCAVGRAGFFGPRPPPYVHVSHVEPYDGTALGRTGYSFGMYSSQLPFPADDPQYRRVVPVDEWISAWDIEVAPYQHHTRPPAVCFGDGHVLMADGSTVHISAVKVGAQVRCVAPPASWRPAAGGGASSLPFVLRTVERVLTTGVSDVFRMVRITPHTPARGQPPASVFAVADKEAAGAAGVLLTRGHPVWLAGEWVRPDEVATATPQRLSVYNFVLSAAVASAASSDLATVPSTALQISRSIVVGGVVCSTIGSDCGERLAALYPEAHRAYGPHALTADHL